MKSSAEVRARIKQLKREYDIQLGQEYIVSYQDAVGAVKGLLWWLGSGGGEG